MSRRDNGLTATSYQRLDDIATHLVDDLLDRLAAAGIAAYSAPSTGRRGPYGDTVPPVVPTDGLYVDAGRHGQAREVTDHYLRTVRDDQVWAELVATFDQEAVDPPHETGSIDPVRPDPGPDLPRELLDELSAASATAYVGGPVGRIDDEDHFEPPPPPPLPEVDRVGRFAWAGAIGGPAFLVLATLLGLRLDGWVGLLALGAFMGGFVTLVARMKDRPPTDSGPDDGAVV